MTLLAERAIVAFSGTVRNKSWRFVVWVDENNLLHKACFPESPERIQDWVNSLKKPGTATRLITSTTKVLQVGDSSEVILSRPETDEHIEEEKRIVRIADVYRQHLDNKLEMPTLQDTLDYLSQKFTAEQQEEESPVVEDHREVTSVEVYTDASQSIDGTGAGLCGWVLDPSGDRKVEFDFLVTKRYDPNPLEALSILLAIMAHSDKDKVAVYSDSQNGIKLVRKILHQVKEGGIINDAFIRGHIRRQDLMDSLRDTEVRLEWVRGHDGNKWNECVNHLVVSTRHDVDELFMFDYTDLAKRAKKRIEQWLASRSGNGGIKVAHRPKQ